MSLPPAVDPTLTGQLPGTSRFLGLRDYTTTATGVLLEDHALEFVDVVRNKPDGSEWRAKWHVVKATIEHTYLGNE